MMATFREFLEASAESGRFGDSPEGDFVADALNDGGLIDVHTWKELENYLTWHRCACREAIKAAKKVYTAWQSSS